VGLWEGGALSLMEAYFVAGASERLHSELQLQKNSLTLCFISI